MQEKTNILLTGASGNVGREVLHLLMQNHDKYHITVFDKFSKKAQRIFSKYKGKIRIISGDLSFYKQVEAASHQIDVVIHLAAIIPPLADDNPKLAERVNVFGTHNLIKALQNNSPNAFFLYSSSVAVYGDRLSDPDIKVNDPLNPSIGDEYAKTKITAEKLIQESKLTYSIFRLSAIMGAKNHSLSKLMFHMPLETIIEICSPQDTARAFVHAIEKKDALQGRVFNLGGGENSRITYRNFLEKNFKLYGLGDFNFPDDAFAKKNFHCGNYADGDDLENILHFRNDNLDTYEQNLRKAINPVQFLFTRMLAPIVKQRILKLSEPLKATKEHDLELMGRFF